MTLRRPILWLGIMLVYAALCGHAQDAQVITYGGQAGSQAVFQATVTGDGQALLGEGQGANQFPLDVKAAVAIQLKILEVTPETERRSLKLRDISFSLNNQVLAQPDPAPIIFRIGHDGAIKAVEQADELPATDALSAGAADIPLLVLVNQVLHFSSEPVAIGDSWTTRDNIKLPSGKQINLTARSKLEGRVGDLLQITTVMDTPITMDVASLGMTLSGTLHAELKRTFDPTCGMIVGSKGPVAVALHGTVGGEGGTPVSVNSTFQTQMKRVPSENTNQASGI